MRRGRCDDAFHPALQRLTAMRPVVLLTHEPLRVLAEPVRQPAIFDQTNDGAREAPDVAILGQKRGVTVDQVPPRPGKPTIGVPSPSSLGSFADSGRLKAGIERDIGLGEVVSAASKPPLAMSSASERQARAPALRTV